MDPILMEGEGHLLTIAPTGAGKGIGCIIPALLRHTGPAIVVDPKGENAMVTARRRREMGHEVVVIDPMGVTGCDAGMLNPLDIIDPHDASGVDTTAALVMAMLPSSLDSEKNRFWINRGRQLLTAVALHVVTDLPESERTLAKMRECVNEMAANPAAYGQRFQTSRHPEVRMIDGNLRIGAPETLGSIISFAQEGGRLSTRAADPAGDGSHVLRSGPSDARRSIDDLHRAAAASPRKSRTNPATLDQHAVDAGHAPPQPPCQTHPFYTGRGSAAR
ncbi:type IV secretory system conjugative DNA transfer family protein (plasmid) [Sinorhizobium meliloti]|nr:type IV secretory system conjugative DNA transfer family protein [Sinorhizobium meliloti]